MSKLDELRRSMGANVTESSSKREGIAGPTLASLSTAKMEGVTRIKNALDIQVDRIVRDPGQPREEFDEVALERLASSLKSRGQIQPIAVRWDEGQGTYVIISGERRWRAARMAGLATLSCVVSDGPLEAGDILATQLIENCIREDLAPIEQAKAFRILMDEMGWSGNRLAQELGIPQSGIVQALALLELPAEVQAMVEREELPASTAYVIGRIEDPEQQREVAAHVVQNDLSRAETVEHVRQTVKPREPKAKGRGASKASPKPKAIKSRTIRTSVGKVTVDLRRAGDDQAFRDALREALSQLEDEAGEGEVAAA